MDHPKEELINLWLLSNPNPSFEDVRIWAKDLETLVMACTLANISLNQDLIDYCMGIPLSDRIERYKPYPLWFKTFIRQDIQHALEILRIDKDSEKYGQMIVDDWVDDEIYLNLVKNANPFVNNQVNLTFKGVLLSDERHSDGSFSQYNIDEEFRIRIEKNEKIEFLNSNDSVIFYFLKLDKFAELSQADLNEMSTRAEKHESFICSDVRTIAKLSDKDVLIYVTSDMNILFDIEPKIKVDKKKLKKDLKSELKEQGIEYFEDSAGDLVSELATLVVGRPAQFAKLAYKISKKALDVKDIIVESVNVTFSDEDEREFYDNFAKQHSLSNTSIREFFIEEIKIPVKRLYIKSRFDISELTEDFFNIKYRKFIQNRFYAKIEILPIEVQKKINQISDSDEKDTTLFIEITKYKFRNAHNDIFKFG